MILHCDVAVLVLKCWHCTRTHLMRVIFDIAYFALIAGILLFATSQWGKGQSSKVNVCVLDKLYGEVFQNSPELRKARHQIALRYACTFPTLVTGTQNMLRRLRYTDVQSARDVFLIILEFFELHARSMHSKLSFQHNNVEMQLLRRKLYDIVDAVGATGRDRHLASSLARIDYVFKEAIHILENMHDTYVIGEVIPDETN